MNLPAEITELIEDARAKRAEFDETRSPAAMHASTLATSAVLNGLRNWAMETIMVREDAAA